MKDEIAEVFKRRFTAVRNNEVVGFVAAGTPRVLPDEEEAARADARARDMRLLSCLLARAATIEDRWADEPVSSKRPRDVQVADLQGGGSQTKAYYI